MMKPAHGINYIFQSMASTRRQPPFDLFYGSREHEPLDVLHSSSSRSWKPPMTRKKVDALPVGQSPMGPGSTLKRIHCIKLTRRGANGLHLHDNSVLDVSSKLSSFSSSALAAAARAGPAAYQCVTEQVLGSSQGCQDCSVGVHRV
jgi:hypothetical protein